MTTTSGCPATPIRALRGFTIAGSAANSRRGVKPMSFRTCELLPRGRRILEHGDGLRPIRPVHLSTPFRDALR